MAVQRGDPGSYMTGPLTAAVCNLLLEGCSRAWNPYLILFVMTAQGMTISDMIEKTGQLGELPGLEKPKGSLQTGPRRTPPQMHEERIRQFRQLLQEGVPRKDIDGQPLSVLRCVAKEKGIKILSFTTLDTMRNGEQADIMQLPGFNNMLYPWQDVNKTVAKFHLKTK